MKAFVYFIGLFCLSLPSLGAELSQIAPIGAHYRLFTVEKSINSQNIMVVYTKLDSQCRFLTDPNERDQPVFDFYWLMDGRRYKRVHPLIKAEVKKRLEFQVDSTDRQHSFYVKLNDMKEVRHDLRDNRLHVSSSMENGACHVGAMMSLGPSAGNANIEVTKFYSEAKRGLIYPTLISISISGKSLASGQSVHHTYPAR